MRLEKNISAVYPRPPRPTKHLNSRSTRILLAACLWLCLVPAFGAETGPVATQVVITGVQVTGSTLLSSVEIAGVLANIRGSRTLAELQGAAAAVQDLYRAAGYGGVVAFLPEQALSSGTLVINVLEGRVAQVVISGNRKFSAANVRRGLPVVQEGLTPKVRAYDTAVQLANENPAKQLAVTLEEGQKRGDIDVRISVIEGAVQRFTLLADNTGNAQTGRTRLTAGYQNAALSDRDDQVSAQVQISPEKLDAVRVFSLGYRLPLYDLGMMLQAYTSYSNVISATAATAAGDLNFSGQGRVLGLELTRFIERAGEFEQRVSVALDKRDYLNNCAIQGLPDGACGSAGASVSVHPLTLNYQNLRKGGRPAGISLALSSNLALGGSNSSEADFDAVRPGASRNFQMLRASAFLSLPVGDNWQLNFRAIGQATSSKLVPGEQFGLTSVGVVRGYEEREVTGDSGLAGSFEVLMPTLLPAPPGQLAIGFHDLRLFGFVDAGVTSNRDGLTCDGLKTSCQLSSIGLGTRFSFGQSLWRIDLARANDNARLTASGDLRIHFSARYAFP